MKVLLALALIGLISCTPGFATRYWDCCKPSCAWPDHDGGNREARTCTVDQKVITDDGHCSNSICGAGGPAMACLSQIPWKVSDTVGYAFAASPGSGANVCKKCFELAFTGEGNWETTLNHKKLKGKKLIVISSNIGYDVEGGQFDIMIPGGGVGMFNGCDGLFGAGNMGRAYGGLLSDCEEDIGYEGSEEEIYEKRKSCLTQKCKTAFKIKEAIDGCLFLADFMEAAGNPSVDYKEVDCPKELLDKY